MTRMVSLEDITEKEGDIWENLTKITDTEYQKR